MIVCIYMTQSHEMLADDDDDYYYDDDDWHVKTEDKRLYVF